MNYGVGFKPDGSVFKAGTKLRARLLQVGMHRMVDDPAALAAKIAQDYGITAGPAYTLTSTHGTVGAPDYPVPLRAGKDECFVGKIAGVAGMAGNLGVTVSGLNDRWTAFCQSIGTGATTDTRTRLIAVEDRIAYAVVRAEDENRTIFLGHPLLADTPEVVLSVTRSRDWKHWVAEIHNPTAGALTLTVRSNPHVTGLRFRETLTVSAGNSVIRVLGPAPAG